MALYNKADYIEETLDTLVRQTFQEWEAIVVDDASTDESPAIVERYAQREPRIRLYRQSHGGPSAARNFGMHISNNAKYIFPLDCDDLIEPTYIEKAVAYMEAYPDTTLVYSKADMFGRHHGAYHAYYTDYKQLLLSNSIFVTALFRREDALAIGGYDENFKIAIEDWDFFIRLLYHHDNVHQLDEVLFHYRRISQSRSKSKLRQTSEPETMLFKKHIDKYIEYFGNPLLIYNDAKWRKKYYNIWYKKLFYSLWKKSKR